MKSSTSRTLVFLGAIALLLFVGAAVSVRSKAGTSAVAVDAPAAAALAASSLYQRSSQPYYVGAGTQGLSNLELRRASSHPSAPGMGSATLALVTRELGVAPGR